MPIIYRTQRAPERRVFYVDVGNISSTFFPCSSVERVKTEIPRDVFLQNWWRHTPPIVLTIPNKRRLLLPKQQKEEDL